MLEILLKEFNLSNEKIEKLKKMKKICLEYNKNVNLTSIIDEGEFDIKHILDSIFILKFYDLNNKKIIDVGTGGGFPGLILAIVLDNCEVHLLDSNTKKINYINFIINELNLKNVKTINERSENLLNIEKYDVVVSRAVATLNILLEITFHLVDKGGLLIFYKGKNILNEFPNDWNVIEKKIGILFDKKHSYILNNEVTRNLISFKKERNLDFSRPYSKIKNNPLWKIN